MAIEKNKPSLIIKFDDKASNRADFLELLANYSAQLYKMKNLKCKKSL